MFKAVTLASEKAQAVSVLQANAHARVLAGGSLLMPKFNTQATGINEFVSLKSLGLDSISVQGSQVTIGAATTLAAIGKHPDLGLLAAVTELIGSPTLRNSATIGGNLFAEQPYGDMAVALVALDAQANLYSQSGEASMSVTELLANGLAQGTLVTSLSFNLPDAANWRFYKAMRRRTHSASICTIAADLAKPRIALGGGMSTKVVHVASLEAALANDLSPSTIEAAAKAALDGLAPITDAYASSWYRARVFPVHLRRALLGES